MRIDRLWLTDFRNYSEAEFSLSPGFTAVIGNNGEGKSNLVEAISFLATLKSFRGAPNDALVQVGASDAFIRAEAKREDRSLLIEAQISAAGRTKIQINRQRLARNSDLLGALRTTVFAPDDLDIIKGGPSGRRDFLNDLLVAVDPRIDNVLKNFERILKQRNALLKQVGGRLDESSAFTLDVWDERLSEAGSAFGEHRARIVKLIEPLVNESYSAIADRPTQISLEYDPVWLAEGYSEVLARGRTDDVRRGLTLIGPHRDDLVVSLGGLASRTHSSQGEQRSLALALRMASHSLVTLEAGASPVLILDDVFSELDPTRADALLRALPKSQTILTTAGPLPPGATFDEIFTIAGGAVVDN